LLKLHLLFYKLNIQIIICVNAKEQLLARHPPPAQQHICSNVIPQNNYDKN